MISWGAGRLKAGRAPFLEGGLLGNIGQLSVKNQVADFQVVRVLRKLLNRVTAVQQNSFVTVNVGNLGLAGAFK